ncbi:MAG: endonuclease, partial [Oxalobacteraceae bacterium]
MTRINVVPAEELSQLHLIAEYRELPRIFNLVRAAVARGERPDDRRNPALYCLGSGHCRFFYPRLGWLRERQRALVTEMLARGYQPNFTDIEGLTAGIPDEWCQDWQPDDLALALNRGRIEERTPK